MRFDWIRLDLIEAADIPVGPHKAVAEVSQEEVSCCDAWMARANPLMGRNVLGVLFWIGCNDCSCHLTTTGGSSVDLVQL